MTWTQLTLHLPGGIRLELLSLYRPPTKCPTLPPPAVIETQGKTLADIIPIRRAS